MKYIAIILISFFSFSCLTIPGSAFFRSIKVETEPQDAKVEVYREGSKIDEIRTPGRVYVAQSDDLLLKISKPGYSTEEVEIRFVQSPIRSVISFSGAVFCALIPFGIDMLTGVLMVPERSQYMVILQPGKGAQTEKEITYSVEYHPEQQVLNIKTATETLQDRL